MTFLWTGKMMENSVHRFADSSNRMTHLSAIREWLNQLFITYWRIQKRHLNCDTQRSRGPVNFSSLQLNVPVARSPRYEFRFEEIYVDRIGADKNKRNWTIRPMDIRRRPNRLMRSMPLWPPYPKSRTSSEHPNFSYASAFSLFRYRRERTGLSRTFDRDTWCPSSWRSTTAADEAVIQIRIGRKHLRF